MIKRLSWEVDLLFLQKASLAFEIISKGKVIYSADNDLRTDYEYLISGRYMDFKYHLDQGYKELYETRWIGTKYKRFEEAVKGLTAF